MGRGEEGGGGSGEGYVVRPAVQADVDRGLPEALESLSPGASSAPRGAVRAAMAEMLSNPNHVVMVAAEEEGGGRGGAAARCRIVGASTLLVEPKLIHGGSRVGHIEDVSVAASEQGRGVGAALVGACLKEAERRGCYKTILDCTEDVRPFYEKMGFARHASEMRYDHVAGGADGQAAGRGLGGGA